MFKVILTIVSLLFISLDAQDMGTQSNKLNQELEVRNSKSYLDAFNFFKMGDFTKSLKLFEQLSSEYPEHEYVNYYYGRSAFELEQYELAYSAFDRVLITNPSNHRARLELARVLFLMKGYKEAKKEFEQVLMSPIPPTVRATIEKFLLAIKDQEKGYKLNKVAIVGFGWDDNINNNTYLNNILYGNLILDNDTNKKSDSNLKFILVGNLVVPYEKNNKITFETTAIAFLQKQRHYTENNMFLTSFTSGIGYVNQDTKFLTSLLYNHAWVGSHDYMGIYGTSLNIKRKILNDNLLSVDLKYKKKKMKAPSNHGKNSSLKELTVDYMMPVNEKKDSLTLSALYIEERKEQGTRVDVSKDIKKIKVSYDKKIFEGYDTGIDYQFEKDVYLENNINLPDRVDKIRTIILRVGKKLNKTNTISTEYTNINTKSEINTYTYKKQSIVLNYTLIF
ncbi:tetratricopeptide repeat protein [Sulfurimonas sp.]